MADRIHYPKLEMAPTIFLGVLLFVIAPFSLRPFFDEIRLSTNWRGSFDKYQQIGQNCKAAFLPPKAVYEQEKMLEEGRASATSYQLPFRAEPKYKAVPANHWTYASCEVTPNPATEWIAPNLFLGPLWGQSQVYINGKLQRKFSVRTYATVALDPETVMKPFTLEVVSIVGKDGNAGLLSLIPLMLVPSDADLRVIDRDLNYFRTEKTLVPLGIAGTMMVLFLCCWIFGIRYRDVYWMTVAAAAAAGSAALYLDPVGDAQQWKIRLGFAIKAIGWASYCAAIYSFLRKKASQNTLIAVVVGVTVLYMLQLVVPKEIIKATIGSIGIHDGVVVGAILIYLGYCSLKIDSQIPKRRHLQRLILGGMLIVLGLFVLVDGFIGTKIGLSSDSLTRTTLIGAFGTFMIIDLVVFQRAFFEEKSLKEEEERRRSALEERMELGFSIQKLLMPNQLEKSYGPFKVHVFYDCAEKMAGDWFYWRDTENELRVLCGDVVGKGPEAAIAATSILTMCHNFSLAEKTMLGFLNRLNQTVAELFRNTSISTVGGVALNKNGLATVFNHGFSGWFVMNSREVELITQRGQSLGSSPDTEWVGQEIKLEVGDKLVIFSDGVAEGPRALKKISKVLQANRGLRLPQIAQIILETGRFSVVDDDRTIVIVEKVS